MVVASAGTRVVWDHNNMDTDADNKVSEQEFKNFLKSNGIKAGTDEYEMWMGLFEQFNGDDDVLGTIELKNLLLVAGGKTDEELGEPSWTIEAMDLDNDGKVSNLEFAAYLAFHKITGSKAKNAWKVFNEAKDQEGGGKFLQGHELERYENKRGEGSFAEAMVNATEKGKKDPVEKGDEGDNGDNCDNCGGTGKSEDPDDPEPVNNDGDSDNDEEVDEGNNTENGKIPDADWEAIAEGGVTVDEMEAMLKGLTPAEQAMFKEILKGISDGREPTADDLKIAALIFNSIGNDHKVDVSAVLEVLKDLNLDEQTLEMAQNMLGAIAEGEGLSPADAARFLNLLTFITAQINGDGLSGAELSAKISDLGLAGSPLGKALETAVSLILTDPNQTLTPDQAKLLANLAPRLVDGTLSANGLKEAMQQAGLDPEAAENKNLLIAFTAFAGEDPGAHVQLDQDVAEVLARGVQYVSLNESATDNNYRMLGVALAGIKAAGIPITDGVATGVMELARWVPVGENGSMSTSYILNVISNSQFIPDNVKDALRAAINMMDSDGTINLKEMPSIMALAAAMEDGTLTKGEAEAVSMLLGNSGGEMTAAQFMKAFNRVSVDGGASITVQRFKGHVNAHGEFKDGIAGEWGWAKGFNQVAKADK